MISFIFAAPYYRDCVLVSKTEVNHNTLIFRLQLPFGTVRHVPVGKHVYLKAFVESKQNAKCLFQLHRKMVHTVQENIVLFKLKRNTVILGENLYFFVLLLLKNCKA